jgi:glycosyltransferase involved in cell wall biosynthesis
VLVCGAVLGQPMGGVRRHNAELLPRAARMLARDGGALDVLAGADGVAFALPPETRVIASAIPAGPPIARAKAESAALARVLAAARADGRPYDLVHTAHLPAPRRLGAPYTLTLHDLRALYLRSAPFVRRLFAGPILGDAVRRAARVLAVSETVRADLLARFRLPPERVAVVPNGADHLGVQPRRPAPGAALLVVGHLEARKEPAVVLAALALDPGLPPVAFAGAAKRDAGERLAARARELGVAARVTWLGAVDDAELARLYATCAAVVLPSRLEGFGIPALEAQRAGAPLAIAVAPGSALREVAGEAVPWFDAGDAQGCARAIRAALARPADELARDAARAARFTWDAAAERLVAAWRGV